MTESLNKKLEKYIEGCKKGSPKYQKLLYQKFYGLMMNISLRYTNNYEDAVEVLNSGFLKIFTKIGAFEGKGSFEGWMKKIMTNTAIDFLRCKPDYHEYLPENESTYFVENEAMAKFNAEEILAFIQQLPPMTRVVFNLYAIEGYSHDDISSKCNISVGTSHWHVANARKILIKKIRNVK